MHTITITIAAMTDRTTLRAVAQSLAEDAVSSLSDTHPDRRAEVLITEGLTRPDHEPAYAYYPPVLWPEPDHE